MTPQGALAALRALPERLRQQRRENTDIIGAVATLRAETLQRAIAGGGSGLGKHVLHCYITAIKDEADGKVRGPRSPIDGKHNDR